MNKSPMSANYIIENKNTSASPGAKSEEDNVPIKQKSSLCGCLPAKAAKKTAEENP